jgi:hypothetical protein
VKITCVQAGVTGESFTTDTQREWLTTPGSRPTSPKDVVIWASPHGTCWSAEWKSQRETGSKQDTSEDRAWLEAFCRENPTSHGYSVFLDWSGDGVLRGLTVARCSVGAWDDGWLRRPVEPTKEVHPDKS